MEVLEQVDDGWWLVKKGSEEGWAPYNYLEPAPAPKAVPTPPPPPRRPVAPTAPQPTPVAKPVLANADAKPVAVFPGMAPSNGSAAPWKRQVSESSSNTASTISSKPPPPIATKPKPAPPVGGKPGAPKVAGKPPVPSAPRPNVSAAPRPSPVAKPAAAVGQLDLAAAVSHLVIFTISRSERSCFLACQACSENGRRVVGNG